MLSESCKGRLFNWKFRSARKELDDGATDHERTVVEALAETFGNSGWFEGHLGTLVGAVVGTLLDPPGRAKEGGAGR